MRFRELRNANDIVQLVQEVGFLPFFANDIRGFSVEENCPPELWFAEDTDGPWEWKGPAARAGSCVYGKLFRGKAGFVSLGWFPDLANYRRDGYDFDARYDEGLAARKDKELYDAVLDAGSLLTKEIKQTCGYGGKNGKKGFDTIITRLQMQTYINVADFEYMTDSHGKPYGWGVARYTTPEAQFGTEITCSAYTRKPQQSKMRILEHLRKLLPEANDGQLQKIIG